MLSQNGFSEAWLCSIFSNFSEDLLEALRAAWLSVMIVHFHSMQQAENTPYSHYRRSMMSFMQYEVLCNEFANSLLLSRFFLQLKLSFPNHLFFWIRRCQGLVTTNWPCSTAAPLLSPGDDLLRTRSTQHVETIIFASRISTRRAIVYLRGQMTDPDRENRERERESESCGAGAKAARRPTQANGGQRRSGGRGAGAAV